MSEDELKEIKELLLKFDQKLDTMIDKLDAKMDYMMTKIELLMEQLEIENQHYPRLKHPSNSSNNYEGCMLTDIDGKSQLFSWDTKDFFSEEEVN
jgi:hypothetical protein